MKKSIDRFEVCNTVFMLIICFLTLYPIWYAIVISFNAGQDTLMGGVYWWPREFSIESYRAMFTNENILSAFGISLFRTIIGTVSHIFFTAMVAYAFLQPRLIGRRVYMTIGLITMFFNGGLIPTFLLVRGLGLIDNPMVYIFPSMFNFFHLLIFQAFFRDVPKSLEESAMIDGMNDFSIFLKIIFPLSMPVVATIALFHGVWHWNDFFYGVIYINDIDTLGHVLPVSCGASLKNIGVQPLLDNIISYLPAPEEAPPIEAYDIKKKQPVKLDRSTQRSPLALIFKIQNDPNAGTMCFFSCIFRQFYQQ